MLTILVIYFQFLLNRKWCLTFAYRPPYNDSKATFSTELNKSLCNIARKYENVLIIGDLNFNFDNLKSGIHIATCLIHVILSRFLTFSLSKSRYLCQVTKQLICTCKTHKKVKKFSKYQFNTNRSKRQS